MSVLHSLIHRGPFVASALGGAIGVFLSVAAAGSEAKPPTTVAPAGKQPGGDTSVRPFKFHASVKALADLRRRLAATKWPSQELVPDASQGVQLATMRRLAHYWQTDYDWRKFEARLNALPQFVTTIDGVDIHFIQVRSKQPNALPIIVTHGWPGSIIEQMKIIDPLTNPTANGGTASDAFDVVIPSLPGHGFSGTPATLGWEGALETARRTIRDGNRASEVVARLRALFRKKEVGVEAVDLNEATREVIALSGQDLQRRRISLQLELDAELPRVSGDRVQLQQVILNLLLNASDAVRTVDDRPKEIVIRTARDEEGAARLMVRDFGVGVVPGSLNKLFDAFYTTKADGMGIGLSVSRSIIESHHGRLWCEPHDGPGATFAFSIPVIPSARRATG